MLEAARAGRIRRAWFAAGIKAEPRLLEIRRLARVEEVAPAELEAMARGAVHQGVVAEVTALRMLSLRDLLAESPNLLVALDGIQDPHNLGAILRIAEAAGADGVLLPDRRSAPLSATAAKSSAGAIEHLRLCQVAGVAGSIPEIKRGGLWCLVLDPEGELLPWEFDLTQRICIVVGGEGQGVSRLARARADARVRLPMRGRLASVNAAAAASAMLYEVVRQRQPRG